MTARHQRATSDLFALLREKAPPKPACFRDQADWIGWLHASESAVQFSVIKIVGRTGKGEANRGRKKTDEIRQDIDYCGECQWEHAELMKAAGKCVPPAWGTQPKASPSVQKVRGPKRPKLPAVPVVSLSAETWQPKVYADITEVILETPVHEDWTYSPEKGGPDDGRTPHDGPMAQDVNRNMGDEVAPNGRQIDPISMNGVLMAGIQGLAQEVKGLKRAMKTVKGGGMAAQGVM